MVLLIVLVFGCQSDHDMHQTPPPQPIDVEYGRLVAPTASQDLGGKLVRVRAAYFMRAPGPPPDAFSPQEYFAFQAVAPGGTMHAERPGSSDILTVVAPRAYNYLLPQLKLGDTLIIEGTAMPSSGSRMILQADSLQKRM